MIPLATRLWPAVLEEFANGDARTALNTLEMIVLTGEISADGTICVTREGMDLTHAVIYLSMSPKSNALYVACEECKKDVKEKRAEPVPFVLRNAPTIILEIRGKKRG